MAGEWRETTLGHVIELKRGYDLPQQERRPGKVPLVSSSGVTDHNSKAMVKGPGVVTGRYGTLGQVFYIAEDFWPLNTTLYVRDFKGNDPRFLSYFLRGLDFLAYSDKAAVPGLNRNHLHQAEVRIPSDVAEQRAIAHIVGTLDEKVELNRRMNETLETMARAIFKSWFVDFDPVQAKAEGRQPAGMDSATAALFPDSFEESPLGKIPQGWRTGTLDALLSEFETGSRPKGGVSGYVHGIPSIGAESIVGLGRYDFSKTKYVPRGYYEQMTKGRVKNRDVLLYKDGGRPGEYEPHAAMFGDGFPFERFCINEHVYRLRANHLASQAFLYFWLTSVRAMDEMRAKGTGVAVPGLNSSAVRSLTTLTPNLDVTRRFEAVVEPYLAAVLNHCNQSHTLAALRDGLLPRLMSGQIRVKDAEKLVGAAT